MPIGGWQVYPARHHHTEIQADREDFIESMATIPEGKRTLKDFALVMAYCSPEIQHATSAHSSLVKMRYVAHVTTNR